MAVLAGKGLVGGTVGLSGANGNRDCVDQFYPVTQEGQIESFNINIRAGNPTVKFKVWRINGSSYDFIGQSQSFNSFSVGDNTGLALTTPIAVLAGDLIGVHITSNTGNEVNAIPDATDATIFRPNIDYVTTTPKANFSSDTNYALAFEAVGTPTGAGSISVDNFTVANQRDIISNTFSAPISGTYSGTVTNIQHRVRYADGAQEVVTGFDWADYITSPTGGTFSGANITLDGSARGYVVDVRFSNDIAATATTSAFYVGDFYGINGESLARQMSDTGTSEIPNTGVFFFDEDTSTISTPVIGDGAVSFGNTITAHTGAAVFISNTGRGGMGLLAANTPSNYLFKPENPTSYTSNYSNNYAAYTAAGDWVANLFIIGINDAVVTSATAADYQQAYIDYFTQWRINTRSDLPIIASLTGVFTNSVASDALYADYVDAQRAAYDATNNLYYTVHYDQPRSDHTHLTGAGYAELGRRMANAVITEILGGNAPYKPVEIDSVSRTSNTETTFTLLVPSGNNLTPSTNITDFALSEDDFTSTISITSVEQASSNSIKVTHAPATVTHYRLNWGSNPDVTGLIKDNSTRQLPVVQSQGEMLTSDLSISISGMADGSYQTVVLDSSLNIITAGSLTYASGSTTLNNLNVPSGTKLTGYVIDNLDPHVDGAVISGTTV